MRSLWRSRIRTWMLACIWHWWKNELSWGRISCRLWSMNRDGFRARVANLSVALFSGASAGNEVEREIAAQIAVFEKTGLPLSHLDSHQHLHMFPPVFQIVKRLTSWMGNVWVRNPVGPWRKSRDTPVGRWVQQLGLNLTSLSARGLRDRSQPQMPDGLYGFEVSGRLTRSALEQILRRIPHGLYELICHPGEDDADTQMRYSHWGYAWAEELETLIAPETRTVLDEQGIVLTSFARALNTGAT